MFYPVETIWLNSLDMHDIAFVTQGFLAGTKQNKTMTAFRLVKDDRNTLRERGGGGGIVLYISYTGMCRTRGYGFF